MSGGIRALSIVGARPQFIKLAPVDRAFAALAQAREQAPLHEVVHTGQHYDDSLSQVFFDQLQLPRPVVDLNVGSGSHAEQTAAMLVALERVLIERKPDVVLVYGDTNSTLAGVMAASKLHIPVVHIEAGLRSFNREMPEEINRVVADHCADLLFAPTPVAMAHLAREGLAERAHHCGDVMYDAVMHNRALAARQSRITTTLGLIAGTYGVVTVHRPSNTDGQALPQLVAELSALSREVLPLVFPMHPRTRALLGADEVAALKGLRVIEPVGYLDMLALVESAQVVLTDSGGLQKEALFLSTPCLTLREETEWVETVQIGANQLIGTDLSQARRAIARWSAGGAQLADEWTTAVRTHYGDGNAGGRICSKLLNWMTQAGG